MGRSAREYIQQLEIELGDVQLDPSTLLPTAGSNPTWTFSEKHAALRRAVGDARGFFITREVYFSLSINAGIREYVLPSEVQGIRQIETAATPTGYSVYPTWNNLTSWRHSPTAHTNLLYLDGEPRTGVGRIYHERPVPLIPTEATLATAVLVGASFIPITPSLTFPREWTPLTPLYVRLDNEIIRVDTVANSFMLGVTRGYFGTVAAEHAVQAVDPYLPDHDGENYLGYRTMYLLMLSRLNKADAENSRTVATQAAEYGRLAEAEKRVHHSRHLPRRFTTHLPRRL